MNLRRQLNSLGTFLKFVSSSYTYPYTILLVTGLSLPCARGAVEVLTPSGISLPLSPGGEWGVLGAFCLPVMPGSTLPSAFFTSDAFLNATTLGQHGHHISLILLVFWF